MSIPLARIEEITGACGVAPPIEALLPIGVRHRQLRVRTLLAGMMLTEADHRQAHLTRVRDALTALPADDQARLGVIEDWTAARTCSPTGRPSAPSAWSRTPWPRTRQTDNTPATVHDGTAWAIQARRQQVLDEAYAARPERFPHGRPLAPALARKVWINQPCPTIQTQEVTQTIQVA